MANQTDRVPERPPGFETELVETYTRDLLRLARRGLPKQLQSRVDPEDVVQSVYRSFFRRLSDGQFRFEGPDDVWKLLATMTFRKACNTRKYHLRERRDARREHSLTPRRPDDSTVPEIAVARDEDIELLWQSLDELICGRPERCRDILVLKLEGHSVEAIAERVGRSRRTVLRVLASVTASATQMLESSP